jgi:uncharacterized protein YndB with AHSA1/START domain
MKRTTAATAIVTAPADRIWAVVSAGEGVHRWFGSVITACELTGSGAGAERSCTMVTGAALKERILEIDGAAHRFRYAIDQHPLPARDVVATIDVADLGAGRTRIIWGAEYAASDDQAGLVDQTLSALYADGIRALEDHCRIAA